MMYTARSHRLFVLLAVGGLLVVQTPAVRAQTIISDRFSCTNGASLQGRTPDTTDLPGSTYTETGFSGTFNAAQIDTTVGNASPK